MKIINKRRKDKALFDEKASSYEDWNWNNKSSLEDWLTLFLIILSIIGVATIVIYFVILRLFI